MAARDGRIDADWAAQFMITSEAIVLEAREWVGVRWRHQASSKQFGADCIGLIAGVGLALGLEEAKRWLTDARRTSYRARPDSKMLLAAANDYLLPIQTSQIAAGDILLMRFDIDPQHFAIVSSLVPYRIIHSYAQMRKVVEHGVDRVWRSRIVGAYRYRGVGA